VEDTHSRGVLPAHPEQPRALFDLFHFHSDRPPGETERIRLHAKKSQASQRLEDSPLTESRVPHQPKVERVFPYIMDA
jgi:hypothetical protein